MEGSIVARARRERHVNGGRTGGRTKATNSTKKETTAAKSTVISSEFSLRGDVYFSRKTIAPGVTQR